MTKIELKKLQKEQRINNILTQKPKCDCGYYYTKNDLLLIKNLNYIEHNIKLNIPIFLGNHKLCKINYKHKLTLKKCIKCNTYFSKKDKHDLCKSCRKIEQLTRICPYCGTLVILSNGNQSFKMCDNCWNLDKGFITNESNFIKIKNYISNKIYNNIFITDLLFNKFYNKKNNISISYLTDSIKWHKFKLEKQFDILKAKEKLISYISLYAINNHFNISLIDKIIFCLVQTQKQIPGYISNTKLDNILSINFETELYGWKNILSSSFDSVIKMFNNFILNNTDGKGEFLFSIIRPDVICNYTNSADILFSSNLKGEIKCGNSKAESGRLLIERGNYRGLSKFNNKQDYLSDTKNKIFLFLNKHLLLTSELKSLIEKLTINDFYWDAFYMQLFNYLKNINKNIANEFVKYIFKLSINNNITDEQILLSNYDLTNNEFFKIFHIVNYCQYYYSYDGKSENISYLIFISNKEYLCIPTNKLVTTPMIELIQILKNWNIVLPSSELTKNNENSNDRNKNRAPGIYFYKK